IAALADRLLEDRRVRGHAAQAVIGDERLEPAARQQLAADIVEPDRLAVILQALQRVHVRCPPRRSRDRASCDFAASTTFSGVKPNFFRSSLNGADAPNVCMPILAPVRPT